MKNYSTISAFSAVKALMSYAPQETRFDWESIAKLR
jgi:hypothetical protein